VTEACLKTSEHFTGGAELPDDDVAALHDVDTKIRFKIIDCARDLGRSMQRLKETSLPDSQEQSKAGAVKNAGGDLSWPAKRALMAKETYQLLIQKVRQLGYQDVADVLEHALRCWKEGRDISIKQAYLELKGVSISYSTFTRQIRIVRVLALKQGDLFEEPEDSDEA